MNKPKLTCEVLTESARRSTSLVDLMRRLKVPMGSGPLRYLRIRLAHYEIDTSHFCDEPLPPKNPHLYTKAQLEEAAANSHSTGEMIEYLGIVPYGSLYSHIRSRLAKFEIATDHFVARRGDAHTVFPRDRITRAVTESHSMANVMRMLGSPRSGAGRAKALRSIEAYGLSTAHFLGQGHQAGGRSPARKTADDILRRLPSGASRTKTTLLRRALDETGVPHACDECGSGDVWQCRRLVLEIDHINGDRLDNRRENLRYLCPSCHSQTASFSNRAHSPHRGQ